MGHSQHVTSSSISLLLAREIEDILHGNDERFKGTSNAGDGSAPSSAMKAKPKPVVSAAVPAMPTSSHLDAVPQAPPINRNRVIHKQVGNQ